MKTRKTENCFVPFSDTEMVSVKSFISQQIETLKMQQRFGTARNYKRALTSFSAYLGRRTVLLRDVDEAMIVGYSTYLQKKGVVRNTVSFYMRILRANFNQATKLGLMDDRPLFDHVYTGVDSTRKRSVDDNIIERMLQLQLPTRSSIDLARDMFVFSFCTRGMAFVDMAFLKKSEMADGTISYVRQKTGHRINIKLEPCIQRIVDKYSNTRSEYVFPIIHSSENGDAYREYTSALGYFNKQLKKLGEMLGVKASLTSYVARHTWATSAHNHNIPISVICAGMGHSSEQITKIYLDSLTESVVDVANCSLLKSLNINNSGAADS